MRFRERTKKEEDVDSSIRWIRRVCVYGYEERVNLLIDDRSKRTHRFLLRKEAQTESGTHTSKQARYLVRDIQTRNLFINQSELSKHSLRALTH